MSALTEQQLHSKAVLKAVFTYSAESSFSLVIMVSISVDQSQLGVGSQYNFIGHDFFFFFFDSEDQT